MRVRDIVWIVLTIILLAIIFRQAEASANACHLSGATDQYDALYADAVTSLWPIELHDPCLLKAQAIEESGQRPTAVSPAGARGLMQVLPATQQDMEEFHNVAGNIFHAPYAITIGALYMKELLRYYSHRRRTPQCEWEMALAAYDAGAGNVDKAQALAGDALCWPDIAPFMHQVTGDRATEVINYVERIKAFREQMRCPTC